MRIGFGVGPLKERPAGVGQYVLAIGAAAYVSIDEGFGPPMRGAMACGAPTVTSDASSMPEVAGDAGFLVDPLDPADIARGLAEAVAAAGADRAGVRARSVAQAARFSWSRTADSTSELYRTLLR